MLTVLPVAMVLAVLLVLAVLAVPGTRPKGKRDRCATGRYRPRSGSSWSPLPPM